MPLLALLDGNPMIAADFLLPEWREEKERNRRGEVEYHCEYCNERMTLATSDRGTPFFRHYPNTQCPNSERETDEHKRLKVAVYQLCKKAGWETTVEAHPPDRSWRADVLATKGDRRVAFEIQLSPISGEWLQERSEKYRAACIESVWLLDKFPKRCPYEIPSRTYVVGWKRRPDEKIPEHVTSDYSENLIEIYCLYKQTATATTSEPLTYWAELRAMLAEFDTADPDHQAMILRGRRTTLIELVTRFLTGELARELDSSYECGVDLEKLYSEQAEAAEYQREALIEEVHEFLAAREMAAIRARIAVRAKADALAKEEARIRAENEARQRARHEEEARRRNEETILLYTYHRHFWWVTPEMFDMDAALQRAREERQEEEEQAREQAIEDRRRFWESYHGTEATLQRARSILGMLNAPIYGPASAVVYNRRTIYQEPRA